MQQYSIIKRNGQQTPFLREKLAARLRKLSYRLSMDLDIDGIVQKVITELYNNIQSRDIDLLASRVARNYGSHPDYKHLASRIKVARLHKETSKDLTNLIDALKASTVNVTNAPSSKCLTIMKKHADDLNGAIVHERDYAIDIDYLEMLERDKLAQNREQILERPSQMMMRLAIDRHANDVESNADDIINTYHTLCKEQIECR